MAIVALLMSHTVMGQVASEAVRPSLNVVDARPKQESKKKTLSLWVGSCDYMFIRLDDKAMTTGRIAQLRSDLSQTLARDKIPGQVTVRHYTLHVNYGADMERIAFATAGLNSQGSKVPHPKCVREKTSAGWFDSSELTTSKAPLIAEAEIEVDGKTYKSRAVNSPEDGFNENSSSPKYGMMKATVFRELNADLASQISAGA